MRAKLPKSEGFVDRGGVRIHYEVYGDGPDTILFIPPWAIVHARVYKAQIPWFSDRFRCLTYDPRGNGRSDRPERVEAYAVDHYFSDALAVLDATGTDAAILFGMSSGGGLAAMLAAHRPERVRAAMLVGTTATIGPGYPYMTPAHFREKREAFEGWDKYNREYWLRDYPEFARFFLGNVHSERHSTKQLEDALEWAAGTSGETLVRTVEARTIPPSFDVSEAMYRSIRCPLLVIHGTDDRVQPFERAKLVAEVTGAEFVAIEDGGHAPHSRYPARVNALAADFLERRLGIAAPVRPRAAAPAAPRASASREKRALYLSSPIGLGHGRRDIAVARELRKLRPGLKIDWLAQDPVTRLLAAHGETIHPLSARLANESHHIEEESGEHDLHAFQAIRRMDEILVANFMRFQEAVERGDYDLVIADESWDVDHYWHEHPELKRSALAWFTDFVGFVPMPEGGAHEAWLTADYNAEMIGHVEGHPELRDRAIFVGNPGDIVDLSFGEGLPHMREWIPKHYEFSGYILGEHPATFGAREMLRARLGYAPGERVCIVTVGGSGVGAPLIRRILAAVPVARARLPELRVVVVAGPRIDPASLNVPAGVEVRAFVPDLDRHLAACDLAVVQGGLTTCMELAAAGTPFLYFPLRNHFEQNFHVAHRLEQYRAGRKMDYATATPEVLAQAMLEALRTKPDFLPVEADGAARAARMIADLL
jgi:pimeloyl-ACP methyl ester carboxylesterase/UDP:flavonoid glycosyltransferase YjiC (YdhE family)